MIGKCPSRFWLLIVRSGKDNSAARTGEQPKSPHDIIGPRKQAASGRSGGMVDAPVSKTGGGNPVSVRLRPSAPEIQAQNEQRQSLLRPQLLSYHVPVFDLRSGTFSERLSPTPKLSFALSRTGRYYAACEAGSIGYWARQASKPPSRTDALNPRVRSCCTTRALVASSGQVQYATMCLSDGCSAAHSMIRSGNTRTLPGICAPSR